MSIHHPGRLGRERTMKRQHIAHGEQAVEIHFFYSLRQLSRLLRCVSDYFHAHAQRYSRHSFPYPTQPHYAHRLAGQFRYRRTDVAKVLATAPAARSHLLRINLNRRYHTEQVRKHHLSHRGRAVGRNIGHYYTMLGSSNRIHDIVTCGKYTYIPQLRQRLNLLPREGHFVCEHHLRVLHSVAHLVSLGAVIYHAIAQRLQLAPRQVARITGISVKYHYLHLPYQLFCFSSSQR